MDRLISRELFLNKHLILGVSGGIAAYKALELLRLLIKKGANVRVIMTENATRFVGPVSFEALSGKPVVTRLFDSCNEEAIGHIRWAEEADGVIIAPATANIIGKIANGIADDALSTLMMAVSNIPVVISPAMNTHMYLNAGVQRNLNRLEELFGYMIVPPDTGPLACGTTGPGKLPDPLFLLDRFAKALSVQDLSHKKILVTGGPTYEYMDAVRFIGNPSSGKMGVALAKAAEQRGAKVTLITGPVPFTEISGVETIHITSAEDMAKAVFQYMDDADIIIKSAAVSDYRPKIRNRGKIKKSGKPEILELERTADILEAVGQRKGGKIVVGFAAETEELRQNAMEKLRRKNLDIIVGNLVDTSDSGFGSDRNRVTFFYPDGREEPLDIMDKIDVAHRLLDRIVMMKRA